jgi:multidrug efflux system membrane fusion protein
MVKADRAAVELARRQLAYTTIRAPFAGVVGARLVFPGSAIKVNETALAVVNRVRPLYVTFSVPEKHLPRLRSAMRTRRAAGNGQDSRRSGAGLCKRRSASSTTAVDASTGTIQMKALLENREEQLTPGQFVNVSLALDTLVNAVVVPAEAVQQGPDGAFLFVVRPDSTVEPRKIEVGASDRGLTAISKGIAVDETVVTDGQLRLTAGDTLVHVKPARLEAAPAAAMAPPAPASGPGR